MILRTESLAEVTVVIPTIGRAEMLRRSLASIAAGDRHPAGLLVVDQSRSAAIAEVVATCGVPGARVLPGGRGLSGDLNDGLTAADTTTVLLTTDDCTAAPDWVAVGARLAAADPQRLFVGRIEPHRDQPRPINYDGQLRYDALSTCNAVLNRRLVLALGGFDERLEAAQDCDLCYRWLRDGRPISYDPALAVTHRHQRSGAASVEYWRGVGRLYGVHLRESDRRILRLLPRELRVVFGRRLRDFLLGFPSGLWEGWNGAERVPLRFPRRFALYLSRELLARHMITVSHESDLVWDRRLGVHTSGSVQPSALGFSNLEHHGYLGTPWSVLRRALRRIRVSPDDVFVDLGCGLGRGVIYAATSNRFARVIGVDASSQMVDGARRNLDAVRARLQTTDVSIEQADLARWTIPDDVTVAFMYNPVAGETFAALITELLASVDRRPRTLRIVYRGPMMRDALLATGRVRHIDSLDLPLRPRRDGRADVEIFELA